LKNVPTLLQKTGAICYDKEESRLIVCGGWANKWLDDVWQINVSSIVGPPYAVTSIKPGLGQVTGGQKIQLSGIGFKSTVGQVVVKFSAGKVFAESQGNVIDDELVECNTPDVVRRTEKKWRNMDIILGN
jgi:dynein heavy chain, axonemal